MYAAYINGIRYKTNIDYEITEKSGNNTSSNIAVVVGEGQPFPTSGDIIELRNVADETDIIFFGTCGIPKSPKYVSLDDVKEYTITCGNGNSILRNRISNVAYQRLTISQIVQRVYDDFIQYEGIELGTISEVDVTLEVYTAPDFMLTELLNELANMVTAMWEITPDRKFNFIVRKEFERMPHIFNREFLVGAELQRTTRSYDMRTVQHISGATERSDPQDETYTYDGEQKAFLTVFPIAEKPQIWVNGVELDPTRIGVTGFDDQDENIVFMFSYNSNSLGYKERTEFLQVGDTVRIVYLGLFRIRVAAYNYEKIAEISEKTGTSGLIERVKIANSVQSTQDATSLAESMLEQFGDVESEVSFWCTSVQLEQLGIESKYVHVMNEWDIQLPEIGINGIFVVTELRTKSLQLVDGSESFIYSMKLKDRNFLKSYGQVLTDIQNDILELAIRPEEVVVGANTFNEYTIYEELQTETFENHFYPTVGPLVQLQHSYFVPLDMGNDIYPV